VSSLLAPCLAQFAVAAADDALWKQLNYQVLLKARHNLPQVSEIENVTLSLHQDSSDIVLLYRKVHLCLYTNQVSQRSVWVKIMGHVVCVV
jgi:hypothetical protein